MGMPAHSETWFWGLLQRINLVPSMAQLSRKPEDKGRQSKGVECGLRAKRKAENNSILANVLTVYLKIPEMQGCLVTRQENYSLNKYNKVKHS